MTQPPAQPSAGALLERAWAHHAAACLVYARQLCGEAAEDATQEAFVRLMSHLARHAAPPENPRAWLLAATRSAAIDIRRAQSRRRHREQARPRSEAFVPPTDDRLDARAVAERLERLPERQREVVVLRIWGELGFAEIASLLGIALSTAHAAWTSGLAELRECMQARPQKARIEQRSQL